MSIRSLVFLLTLCVGFPVRSQETNSPIVPDLLRSALMGGRFQEAADALDQLDENAQTSHGFWAYLRAQGLARQGELDAAIALFETFEGEHGDSPWRAKASFARAELLGELGRWSEAESIWEREALRLASSDRKGELAGIYLRLADALSKAPAEISPAAPTLDYERALALYGKVLELDAPHAAREQAAFRIGVCFEELERWGEAAQSYQSYLTSFDPTEPAFPIDGQSGQSVFEAHLRKGRCQARSGNTDDARRTWENLDRRLQSALDERADARADASERLGTERAIAEDIAGEAAYSIAETWSDVNLAIAALERFQAAHPAHRLSTRAAFEIAERSHGIGHNDFAHERLEEFLARPALTTEDAELRAEAETLRQRALFLRGRIELDLERFDQAIATWSEYVARHPAGADWAAAQTGIVDAHYQAAWDDQTNRRFAPARERWETFLKSWPLDSRAPIVSYQFGALFQAEAVAATPNDRAGLEKAVAAWRQVVQKYRGSDIASNALYSIGLTCETGLGQLEEAIEAYRACTSGSYADAARARLEVMTRPSLAVTTERTRRSNEAVSVEAKLRNVEAIEVALYRVDLEAYFRKHLTNRRIEDLDLDLIAPDQTFEIAVADYEPFAPFDQSVELPVEGPGVWAVAISAGELRATTLVVRSDIELIAKSSRRELFVFAQDMLAGQPASDVRILAALLGVGADGSATLTELSTDADGIARLASDDLSRATDVRLFAHRGGHSASNGLNLGALQLTEPLTPRGFVLTDRPAYHPGSEVRWRAVLREVDNGCFTFEPGRAYRVELLDPSGRAFARRSLELSEFGTLNGAFALDAHAPTGRWQVRCQGTNGPSFQGSFEVATYELAKVELQIEPVRPVWYRGEVVECTVRAQYYYGEPLAGARVVVGMPDGRQLELRTSRAGTARFEYPTRDEASERALVFRARIDEEAVQASARTWLAQRGFAVRLTTARDVYLAGESFGVDIRATTPDSEPAERDLTLVVARRSQRKGRIVEEEVERRDLATGPDGTASVTLALASGGDHVIRIEGRDRFGNPVIAERHVSSSGDEDGVRLRLLANRTTADVGERVQLNLHSRVDAGLALVTFEADRVLAHRILDLRAGANPIELELLHEHWPNVAVAAAMMDENRFHTAALELTVERQLSIRVEPERETYAPGDEASVRVTVRDQLGRPVRAELSLAVVDEALFGLYARSTPKIDRAFAPPQRRSRGSGAALETTSTCTFGYQGVTVEIAGEVLAEARRAEEAKQWDERRLELAGTLLRAEVLLAEEPDFASDSIAMFETPSAPAARSILGVGGGSGGRYGYRAGGKRQQLADTNPFGQPDDTAFWTAAVVTDESGLATISFRWPERSTRWRLTTVGVGAETLVGETDTHCTTRAELFGELRVPTGLVAGDQPRLLARVHNPNERRGRVELRLRVGSEGERITLPETIELDGRPTVTVVFPALERLAAGRDFEVELELQAAFEGPDARTASDVLRRTIDVAPAGLEHVAARAAVLRSRRTLRLELPDGCRDRSLEIVLGIGIDQLLIDAVRGPATRTWHPSILPPTRAGTASALFGEAALSGWLQGMHVADAELAPLLTGRIEARVAELVSTQREDGSWPWIGSERHAPASVETSALALVALASARDLGVNVPTGTLEAGLAFLDQSTRSNARPSQELESLTLFAQALYERADFAEANRLHRTRRSLSPAALAWLALALAEMDRAPMAADVGQLIEEQAEQYAPEPGPDSQPRCRWSTERNDAWHSSTIETVALAVLALEAALPSSAHIEQGLEFLTAQAPWYGRPRGFALAALARHRGLVKPAIERSRVEVRVNGAPAGTHDFGPGAARTYAIEIQVPDDAPRAVVVELVRTGNGEPHVASVLRGFAREVEAAPSSPGFGIGDQRFVAEHPRYAGHEIRPGFRHVRAERETWTNVVEHLEFGRTTKCRVFISRDEPVDDFLVLDVPLPAGARVLEGSVQGNVLGWHAVDGRLVLHLGQRPSGLSYELVGVVPGEYQVRPSVLWSLGQPGRRTWNEPTRLTVLAAGEESPDEYRPTPDELYEIGRQAFEAEDFELAQTQLEPLYTTWGGNLDADVLKETARILMFLAIRAGDERSTVQHFEVLEERYPELWIPIEDVRRVGQAYRELEEFERAASIFRATIDETFGKDLKVAGALEELRERAEALATLDRLYLEFPDFPTVLETRLATCDKRLAWGSEAARDEGLRRAGLDRAALSFGAIRDLRTFLTLHSTDPVAPDAALNLVSAHLEIEDYETASQLAGEMAGLYSEPDYADAFGYTRAVAEWYLGRDAEALDLLVSIAKAEYVGDLGATRPSKNRDLALYILGQIHHARREIAAAIGYYDRVDELFTDAREALAGLREKEIELEELTTVKPGAAIELWVTHKNVERAELLVYSVDLLTLALREKNLANIASIELAGISPTIRRTVELPANEGLFESKSSVALELTEPGAYLVLCRGGELFSSGLVLVSDLELEIEEDARTGRVRVQAVGPDGAFVRDVDVRVIGSSNSTFESGRTDPRGLFVAETVRGSATVIARMGSNHYAFHRGQRTLGVEEHSPSRGRLERTDYLKNVIDLNRAQQTLRQNQLDDAIRQERKGVRIDQVK